MKKLFITPWFGPLPSWFERYWAHRKRLTTQGYDWLLTTDLPAFQQRVKDKLGISCPIIPGTGKLHDFRPALGLLFEEEARDYDFWGHTDFDCVYGRVEHWVTDEFLDGLDVHSNHHNYICGPWTLYRNCANLNQLFRKHPDWRSILENPVTTGWAETSYTEIVDQAHDAGQLRRCYTFWQGNDPNVIENLRITDDGTLTDEGVEIFMFHFRHRKEWPLK